MRSILATPAWYIIDSQMLPCGSNSRSRPPFGCSGLSTGIGDVLHLAGLGIELADELGAEVRVPGLAVGIDDDVMRHRFFARQIVFGDDDMGGAALRPRQRLELIFGRSGLLR